MSAEQARMPKDAAAGALRTVINIAERKWSLTNDQIRQLLGAVGESTYFRWKQNPGKAHVTHDTLERLSYLLGIYKALGIIYADEAVATGWLRRANDNPLFGGRPPLERMMGGNVADLFVVRQHLDARRGGGWA